jgi:hypothetical protein
MKGAHMNLQELIDNRGITILIIGLAGSGKTASIRNLDPQRTLILTSEPWGLETLLQKDLTKQDWKNVRVLNPTTKQEWEKAVKNTALEPDVDTIVVDTLSSWHDMFMEAYINNQKSKGKEVNQLGLDLYRVANLQLQDIMRNLLHLPDEGKNLIMMCHMKYRTDENSRQMKEPALSDNLTSWICRQCSVVLRAERLQMGRKTEYRLIKAGAAGDFGSDKTGAVGDTEPNDLKLLLSKILSQRKPLEKKKIENQISPTSPQSKPVPSATEFDVKKKTQKEAYAEYIRVCIEEAPAVSKSDARKFAEDIAGCSLAKITPKQYDRIIRKFKEKYTLPI